VEERRPRLTDPSSRQVRLRQATVTKLEAQAFTALAKVKFELIRYLL
jgi:hypothetical protein